MKHHLAYLFKICHPLGVAGVCLALLQAEPVSADAYGSGWYGELQVSAAFEDNVSRSVRDYDAISDSIARVSVGGGYSEKVGVQGELLVSGYLTYSQHDRYRGLNNLATSFGMRYIHQVGMGFNQPWLELSGQISNFNYQESQQREGLLFESSVKISRRVGYRLITSLSYRYADVVFLGKHADYVSQNAAFDIAFHELMLGASYRFNRTIYLYSELGLRHGGLTSNNSPIRGNYSYEVESPDHVFDACADPSCQNRYAYRTVADSVLLNLGISFEISGANLDLSALYSDAKAETGPGYQDWIVQLGATWNF